MNTPVGALKSATWTFLLFGLGIRRAVRNPMTDVALNILALIAGGLTLELFTSARPFTHSQQKPTLAGTELPEGLEDFAGNPS